MSKAFTTAEVGVLVERQRMQWETPVSKILPKFHHFDARIQNESNLVDWMSHRTGLAAKNLIWSQDHGQASLRRKDALPIVSYLEKIFDFRTRWIYNNWGYAIADEVITRLGSMSWGEALKQDIFDPLGMERTITTHDTKLDNVAEGYMAYSNGTLHHEPRPFPEDGKVMEGAVAVQSCIHDLLIFYKEVMRAAEDQISNKRTKTKGSPLVQLESLLQGHIPLSPDAGPERSYGLGWIRTELPGTLGVIGLNERYTKEMPLVGKGMDEPQMCIYHQGSTNSFLCSVHLLPKTHSGVVVLTNSMANNDAADWLGELLLEALLDNPDKNDYIKLAQASAERSKSMWQQMQRELEANHVPGTKPKPLEMYTGKFYNLVENYFIEVILKNDALLMCFQGNHDQLYKLSHYHYDVFSWLLTRDEDVCRGRFPDTRVSFYLLSFKEGNVGGRIDQVVWVNDSLVPEGEVFKKRSESGATDGPI